MVHPTYQWIMTFEASFFMQLFRSNVVTVESTGNFAGHKIQVKKDWKTLLKLKPIA